MDIYLIQNNKKFRLPVVPSSFELNKSKLNTTENIAQFGEISMIGKNALITISFESFFPNQYYSFCSYKDFPKPYDCVTLVDSFMDAPVRLMITGANINTLFTIESFKYGENDGTGDVNYSIDFKEYKKATVSTVVKNVASKKVQNKVTAKKRTGTTKSATSNKVRTYKIKKGDTLMKLSKKFYGTSSKYKYLAQLNGIKNPNKIYAGDVIRY